MGLGVINEIKFWLWIISHEIKAYNPFGFHWKLLKESFKKGEFTYLGLSKQLGPYIAAEALMAHNFLARFIPICFWTKLFKGALYVRNKIS